MGLRVSHGCWNASCTFFNAWRHRIAALTGYPLSTYTVEFASLGSREFTRIVLDEAYLTDEACMGIWDFTPADALIVLFAHSDTEGAIFTPQQIPLAARLEAILPMFGNGLEDLMFAKYTREFIIGLNTAHNSREAVTFS